MKGEPGAQENPYIPFGGRGQKAEKPGRSNLGSIRSCGIECPRLGTLAQRVFISGIREGVE